MAPNRRAKKDDHHGGGPPGQGGNNNQRRNQNGGMSMPLKCCRPKGCLEPKQLIYIEDIESGGIEVVRVTCNNLQCDQGNYMHAECFNDWEGGVLNFLSSTGRARSWSVKQRQQNLWTKKGYDLAFKACDCTCGKGHLRKDLDWIPPTEKFERARNPVNHDEGANHNNQNQNPNNGGGGGDKKKKKKGKETLPTLSLSAPVAHPNDNHGRKKHNSESAPIKTGNSTNGHSDVCTTNSTHSVSSGVGSLGSDNNIDSPPPSSGPWTLPESKFRDRFNSVSSNASGSSGAFSNGSGSPPSPDAQFGSPISSGGAAMIAQNAYKFQRKNSSGGGDRTRHNSTGGTTFARRSDFSTFNFLPRIRRNSYNIKVDDDGHGNDDMRSSVLAAVQNNRLGKVSCCMCQAGMAVYDRYPLIDGTFFISPRKYGKEAVPMPSTSMSSSPGEACVTSTRYLTAICMHCLQGRNGGYICRSCGKAFDTSAIIIGAVYSYDIFATMTCCSKRVECMNCRAPLHPDMYKYFHQSSNLHRCMRCGFVDFHFAKPLDAVFQKLSADQFEMVCGRQQTEERLKLLKHTNCLTC